MALQEIGCDGGLISVQVTGFKKNIIGIESVTFGFEKEQTKVRGSGGGWHRGYAGPGFKVASDGSMSLWHNTFQDWVALAGGEDAFLDLEFDVTIITQQADNPTIKTVLKQCRPLNMASTITTNSPDNILCEFSFSVVRIETTVG
jgi:hypothetical protein